MSRHFLPCHDPRYFAVVGWDPINSTYFVQVIDREKLTLKERYKPALEVQFDYRSLVVWHGTEENEIPGILEIEAAFDGYATLLEDVKQTLKEEEAVRKLPRLLDREISDRSAPGE